MSVVKCITETLGGVNECVCSCCVYVCVWRLGVSFTPAKHWLMTASSSATDVWILSVFMFHPESSEKPTPSFFFLFFWLPDYTLQQ